jgi:hypothetical protein
VRQRVREVTPSGGTGDSQPLAKIHSRRRVNGDDHANALSEKKKINHEIAMQRFLAKFVCAGLGFSSAAALALFYLQGFRVWGFRLETSLMHWIGITTVGAIAGLATTVYGAFFKKTVTSRKSKR